MIALIDYGAGNIRSVQNALARLGVESKLTNDAQELQQADKVIFPGVGEASFAMNQLQEQQLDRLIPNLQQPVLGICLGMQLLCNYSEEGSTKTLGIFDTTVKEFEPKLNVPHTGWNSCKLTSSSLFQGIKSSDDFYFVHSFYAEICDATSATCDYIQPFSAALQKDNFYGVQFHPEKSAEIGTKLIQNFLEL
ncbi:MAG: imidazole glycerol phosphate synthase subunit HisH [Crocinitomicaceae bacterium]|nr:imidazole glycerol phosphate synthase subunit HisH [Crocinitomicaceae bacterium]